MAASLASSFASIPFHTLTPAALPGIYTSLPKNAGGLVDLKVLLAFCRSLLVARGAVWDVEAKLTALEAAPGHDEAVENGFTLAAFTWTIEVDLDQTEESNRKKTEKKEAEAREEQARQREHAEEEARALEAEQAAQRKADEATKPQQRGVSITIPTSAQSSSSSSSLTQSAPAESLRVTSPLTSPLSTPMAATPSTPPMATPTSRSRTGAVTITAPDSGKINELEHLFTQQRRELEKSKKLLRDQATLRTQFERFKDESKAREEDFYEKLETLQIKLTRERLKTKQLNAAWETKVDTMKAEKDASASALEKLQSDHKRLQVENARLQSEVEKVHNLSTDLASASAAETAAASAALAASRNAERLEKKLADFNALLAEHEALQEEFHAQRTEAAVVAQAYEQLHAAYTSEEQLYKDAVVRIQVLEQQVAASGMEYLKRPTSTATPAGGHAGEGAATDGTTSGATEAAGAGVGGPASPPALQRRESLLDDLLDVAETPSDHLDLPLPPTAHTLGTPPQSHSKGPSPGSIGQKRLSFTHPSYALLLQTHPPPALVPARPFAADAQDATAVNFQFFQLVAVAVASHLSCEHEFAALAHTPLPIPQLYEEAMEKQVHVHRYAHWLDGRLRATTIATAEQPPPVAADAP